MAPVASFPLHVTADATFSGAERAAIEGAVLQWNALGRSLIRGDFFVLQFAPLSTDAYTADPRDCSQAGFGKASGFMIVRETSARRWQELKFGDSIPAATLRCFSRSEVDHQVVLAYMSIIDPLQFPSIVLHELGHSIGLDHSCLANTEGLAKFRGCRDLSPNHPYHLAVMFPTLQARAHPWDVPEIKDQLKDNDILRTECLYRTAP